MFTLQGMIYVFFVVAALMGGDAPKTRAESQRRSPDAVERAGYPRSTWYNQNKVREALRRGLANSDELRQNRKRLVSIYEGDNVERLKRYLAARPAPCQLSDRSIALMHVRMAVLNNSQRIFEYLLAECAKAGSFDPSGEIVPFNTLCIELTRLNQHEMLRLILTEYKVSPDELSDERKTSMPLCEAAVNGYYECAKVLLDAGADTHKWTSTDWSPLTSCCINDRDDIARLFIERGADVNERTISYDTTPVMYAVKRQAPKVLKVLIENGADVNAIANKAESGWCALHHLFYYTGDLPPWKITKDSTEVLDILYSSGFTETNITWSTAQSILEKAAESNRPNSLRYLCDHGFLQRLHGPHQLYAVWYHHLKTGRCPEVTKVLWQQGFANITPRLIKFAAKEEDRVYEKQDYRELLKSNMRLWFNAGRMSGYYTDWENKIPAALFELARCYDPEIKLSMPDLFGEDRLYKGIPTRDQVDKLDLLCDQCELDLHERDAAGKTIMESADEEERKIALINLPPDRQKAYTKLSGLFMHFNERSNRR